MDFPRRMREWLFNVMTELSERKELSYHYRKMEKEAKVSEKFSSRIRKRPFNNLTEFRAVHSEKEINLFLSMITQLDGVIFHGGKYR